MWRYEATCSGVSAFIGFLLQPRLSGVGVMLPADLRPDHCSAHGRQCVSPRVWRCYGRSLHERRAIARVLPGGIGEAENVQPGRMDLTPAEATRAHDPGSGRSAGGPHRKVTHGKGKNSQPLPHLVDTEQIANMQAPFRRVVTNAHPLSACRRIVTV